MWMHLTISMDDEAAAGSAGWITVCCGDPSQLAQAVGALLRSPGVELLDMDFTGTAAALRRDIQRMASASEEKPAPSAG